MTEHVEMAGHIIALSPDGTITEHPWPADAADQLAVLRRIVGGDIELAAASGNVVIYCHAEGWLIDLPHNAPADALARLIAPHVAHRIAGTVAIAGSAGEHTTALPAIDRPGAPASRRQPQPPV